MLDTALLKAVFEYREGKLYYKSGKEAGYVKKNGYMYVTIDGNQQLVHRIIYQMHHNELPKCVDHINGDKSDNHIENLRSATYSQNSHNYKVSRVNTSGVKGVSLHKATGKWRAQIKHEGVGKHLGYFQTIDAAAEAVKQARIELHGEFARHK